MSKVQSIRGMHDILPAQTPMWRWFEQRLAQVFAAYDFHEIRLPIVEKAEVFTRAIGQATDVVEKEMYAFKDRNGDLLSLRPEGTAAVVRSVIQHGLLQTPGLKLWYQGPMFRHERPQRGRQRQFHQFGAEVFGLESPATDAELIALGERLWRELGLDGRFRLEINTLGDRDDRRAYRKKLVDFLRPHSNELDADSQRRLESNPLRIFDSKSPKTREIMADAPRLIDEVGPEAHAHFEQVRDLLDELGIEYRVNPGLVRGLDYYSRTVFEWITDDLGAQGTVCAGGRYNDLVAMLGGSDVPGIGFALGVERLLALLEADGVSHEQKADVFVVSQVDAGKMLSVAEGLRNELPGLSIAAAVSGGSMRSQFRRADRSGARWCVILGEEEFSRSQAAIKDLRSDSAQETVELTKLSQKLGELFGVDSDT